MTRQRELSTAVYRPRRGHYYAVVCFRLIYYRIGFRISKKHSVHILLSSYGKPARSYAIFMWDWTTIPVFVHST